MLESPRFSYKGLRSGFFTLALCIHNYNKETNCHNVVDNSKLEQTMQVGIIPQPASYASFLAMLVDN
jgi:hypothetical protein